jgi:hypothetical protein
MNPLRKIAGRLRLGRFFRLCDRVRHPLSKVSLHPFPAEFQGAQLVAALVRAMCCAGGVVIMPAKMFKLRELCGSRWIRCGVRADAKK